MHRDSDRSVWTTEVRELRNGVNVARDILPERLDELPILVLISSNEPCEINADRILTELTLTKCAEENDENELTAEEGHRSYKHLSKLMEGVDERVSEEQRVELIKILREYSDVFSAGELDLGETSLATHQIDTGDARPMRKTLRRQLCHFLDKIDEHVVKTVETGVIEPSCSPWTSNGTDRSDVTNFSYSRGLMVEAGVIKPSCSPWTWNGTDICSLVRRYGLLLLPGTYGKILWWWPHDAKGAAGSGPRSGLN